MSKKLIAGLALLIPFIPCTTMATEVTCSNVTITQILSGPRHGAMMKVSTASCGVNGYICLDPEAQFMTQKVSDRVYAFALSAYTTSQTLEVTYHTSQFPSACGGGYPSLVDIRSQL